VPRYEYACTSCDERFEVVQSFTDDALTDCPVCDDGRLRKLFGNVGVVFKGSGFYRTDSRSDARADAAKTSPPSEAPSGGAGDTSTSTPADPGKPKPAPAAAPAAGATSAA